MSSHDDSESSGSDMMETTIGRPRLEISCDELTFFMGRKIMLSFVL